MTLLGRIFGVECGHPLIDKYKRRRVSKAEVEVRYYSTYGESGSHPIPHFLILIHEAERVNGRPTFFPDIFCEGPNGDDCFRERYFLDHTAQDEARKIVNYLKSVVGIETELTGHTEPGKLQLGRKIENENNTKH